MNGEAEGTGVVGLAGVTEYRFGSQEVLSLAIQLCMHGTNTNKMKSAGRRYVHVDNLLVTRRSIYS
jgi:hypothetical protein